MGIKGWLFVAAAVTGATLLPAQAHAAEPIQSGPTASALCSKPMVNKPVVRTSATGVARLRGEGFANCNGVIRLMEERWYWADRVIAYLPFEAAYDGSYVDIDFNCSGEDFGNVYTQVSVSGHKVNSGSVNFGPCGG
ncbi:hypothetical protein [Catellatospora sp. NPDC049609]|uniref:hypothetical protein n=1 Tax=Catellatospora sp. NPDC049609 TaxID=3155505 RepID=UPI0034167732